MNRSKSQVMPKVRLPNGIATNGDQLKHLQRKLLQNHYNLNASNLHRQTAFNTGVLLSGKDQEMMTAHRMNQYDSYLKQTEKQSKAALSHDLMEQMRVKSIKKNIDRQQSLNQEYQLSKNIDGLDSLEREKQKQFNQKYKMQALQDLKIKASKRQNQAINNAHQKQYYKNRYTIGEMAQSKQALERNASYTNPTKNYYYQMDHALRDRDRKVVNPQSLPRNSSFKITRRADSLGQLDFMAQATAENQYSAFYQDVKDREARDRQQLKNTLLSQIREKDTIKKVERSRQFTHPYTTREYQEMHHPIYNPVDLRYAADNRYVLKELTSIK